MTKVWQNRDYFDDLAKVSKLMKTRMASAKILSVIAISKGKKENTLSTATCKRELERTGITKDHILMEFVSLKTPIHFKQRINQSQRNTPQ
jgi:hypothetical protein